jgi:hypothetical protein
VRTVFIDQLKTGDRIAKDVYADPGGLPLLKAGIRMSDSYRESLRRAGIPAVWVDDGLSQGIEPLEVLSDETKRRATAAVRDAFRDAPIGKVKGKELPDKTVRELIDVVDLIIAEVAENVHAALALNDLANADGYTLKHSLAVTTLGLSLGLRVMQRYGYLDAINKVRFDGIHDRLPPLGVGLPGARHREAHSSTEILQKPGTAHRRRVGGDEGTSARRRPHPAARQHQPALTSRCQGPSRAVGWRRISGGAGWRRHPSVRAHRRSR